MGIQVTSTFKPCEDYALEKAKKRGVSNKAVACSKILGERLFFDISSPSTLTFGGKKHWPIVMEDSNDYAWSCFLKEKSDLAAVMSGLTKKLKNKYVMQVQYLHCDNAGENVAFKNACKQEWLGVDFRYATTKWPCQTTISYSLQWTTCNVHQWKIQCFSTKWLMD